MYRGGVTDRPSPPERLLVCIRPNPQSTDLLRAARRMADRLAASWIVAWVDSGTQAPLSAAERDDLGSALRLAEELGADTAVLSGDSVSETLVAFARDRGVSKIVVGKPTHRALRDRLRGSLLDELARRSAGMDLYVLSGEGPEPELTRARRALTTSAPRHYAGAAAVVALNTLVCRGMLGRFESSNLIMVYLLGVAFVATRWGQGPSALAACLSVGAFDLFFVPPHLTFAVEDTQYLLTFGVMLVVGLLISRLAARVREQTTEVERTRLAAETERLRNALLSSVSHDLRTPLGVIEGAASTLLEDPAVIDGATRHDLVQTIHEEADRLGRQVRNLLDMTRLEGGALVVGREWESLEEVVGAALDRVERGTERRRVTVDLPAALLVPCDAVLLEQVFVNLLENALKYSPPESPIEVSAAHEGGEVVASVADRGPGIPAGARDKVFEKFFRLRDVGGGGVGLGLAICRGIVAAHGGRIWVEDRPGGGAVFRLALPAGVAPEAPPAEAAP
jgi:two-component system sensor histidine kinase KdpD